MIPKLVPTLEQIIQNSHGKFEEALRNALHSAVDKLTLTELQEIAFKQNAGQPAIAQPNMPALRQGLRELAHEEEGYLDD